MLGDQNSRWRGHLLAERHGRAKLYRRAGRLIGLPGNFCSITGGHAKYAGNDRRGLVKWTTWRSIGLRNSWLFRWGDGARLAFVRLAYRNIAVVQIHARTRLAAAGAD